MVKSISIKLQILLCLFFFSLILKSQSDTLQFIDSLTEQEIEQQKTLLEYFSNSTFWTEDIYKECDCATNDIPNLKSIGLRGSRILGKKSFPNINPKCSPEKVQQYITEMDSVLSSFISITNQIKLSENIIAYKESKLWGVKNSKGKILLKPSFVQIEYDTINHGIIAFDSVFSYYFTQDFKQKFKEQKYYSISPIDKNFFIIQSATGFGISDGEKEIISANNFEIKEYNKTKLYKGLDKDLIPFWLSPNYSSKIYTNGAPHIYDNDFWNVRKKLFDIKRKKQLFCTKNAEVTILSLRLKLVKVKQKHHSEVLLFNYNGKRVGNQIYTEIRSFSSENLAVASVIKNGKVLYGLINSTGQWIIEPQFPMMYYVKGYYRTQDSVTNKIGLLDKNGSWILKPQHQNIICFDSLKNIWLTRDVVDEKNLFDVIDIQKKRKLHSALPYRTIEKKKIPLSDKYFILGTDNKAGNYDLLDENFQIVIVGKNCSYRFFDNKIIQTEGTKARLFDFAGNEISLSFHNKKLDNLAKIKPIGMHTAFVYKADTERLYSYFKGKLIEVTPLSIIQKSYYCQRQKQDDFFSFSFAKNHGLVKSDGTDLTLTNFRIPGELDTINWTTIYEASCGDTGIYFLDKNIKSNYLQNGKQLGFNLFSKRNQKWGTSFFIILDANGISILNEREGIFELYGGLIKIWDKETLSFYDRTGKLVHSF